MSHDPAPVESGMHATRSTLLRPHLLSLTLSLQLLCLHDGAVLFLYCSSRSICYLGRRLSNMDLLRVTASILTTLQLSSKVVEDLANVKDRPRESAACAVQVSNLHSFILNLKSYLEEGNVSTPWFTATQALAVTNMPLGQYKQTLMNRRSAAMNKTKLTRLRAELYVS